MVSLRGFVLDKPSGFRGQGSLEYLLVIGVVILIAAVVIGAITGVLSFGRIEASQEQADSVYTGLQDVMDLSKGRTILNLKLKRGENVLEFNDTVEKTIWTIFGSLPENTQIIFSGATCKDNPTLTEIDANKKPDGAGSNFKQNPNATLQGTIVNLCVVPTNTQVTINVPQETEINIPIEKEGEVYQEIANAKDFNAAIWANPNGYFKLTQNINLAQLFTESITDGMILYNFQFTGKIIADQPIKIISPCKGGFKVYLFKGVNIIYDNTNITLNCVDEERISTGTQICWNQQSACKIY